MTDTPPREAIASGSADHSSARIYGHGKAARLLLSPTPEPTPAVDAAHPRPGRREARLDRAVLDLATVALRSIECGRTSEGADTLRLALQIAAGDRRWRRREPAA
ncbi:hypothetical protein [Falsiroseomonas oryzae]|uniref:hypothetical protein n=1 Tax=Falsiroseomonas oryzae TaxID=2766473 RepID=UPI0022EA33EA|nr:hypothetical protein [Roseomonas sp. MO-31]